MVLPCESPSTTALNGVLVPEGLGRNDAAGAYATPIRSKPIRMADITDGLSKTLTLAECSDCTVDGDGTWTQPRYSWPYVSDVGGVRSVAEGIAVELLQSLTSRAGGEVVAVP